MGSPSLNAMIEKVQPDGTWKVVLDDVFSVQDSEWAAMLATETGHWYSGISALSLGAEIKRGFPDDAGVERDGVFYYKDCYMGEAGHGYVNLGSILDLEIPEPRYRFMPSAVDQYETESGMHVSISFDYPESGTVPDEYETLRTFQGIIRTVFGHSWSFNDEKHGAQLYRMVYGFTY